MRTSHVAPIARLTPGEQSFAPPVSWVKSGEPLITTLPIGTGSLPTLVIVAVCEVGPASTSCAKVSVSGLRASCAKIPVPVRPTWKAGAFDGSVT
jgi:hypothetical protein